MNRAEKRIAKLKRRAFLYDDQIRLNYGLLMLSPAWRGDGRETDDTKTAVTPDGFKVTLLSNKLVCRAGACKAELLSSYYVWHPSAKKNQVDKVKAAEKVKVWFLGKDWETHNSTATGELWLREISDLT